MPQTERLMYINVQYSEYTIYVPCSLNVQFQLSVVNNPDTKHSPFQLSFNIVLKSNALQRNLK
jgi:acetamidase/formamidase